MSFPFNVRVYGILVTENDEVLVCDELIRGQEVTKFPGGGLEFGEGTRDCLKREFLEEMNLQVEVTDHLYTTDFFVPSAWNPAHQVLSIYYRVRALEPMRVRLNEKPFDFDEEQLGRFRQHNETESFRLVPRTSLRPEDLTLPIDQVVAGMITG